MTKKFSLSEYHECFVFFKVDKQGNGNGRLERGSSKYGVW